MPLNLGAVVLTEYDFDLLAEGPTPILRALRMYLIGWILIPIVVAGPAIGATIYAKTTDAGAPSPLKTVLFLATIIWGIVVAGVLNHRREKLYEWRDNMRQ